MISVTDFKYFILFYLSYFPFSCINILHELQHSMKEAVIQYVVLVYEAAEFCNLVINESLLDHTSGVRSCYPSHTICYLTNRLMSFINKR